MSGRERGTPTGYKSCAPRRPSGLAVGVAPVLCLALLAANLPALAQDGTSAGQDPQALSRDPAQWVMAPKN